MNRNSTLVGLCMLILLTSFATNSLKAQNNALPQLFAGTVSFRVVLNNNIVNLHWTADAETNNKYFFDSSRICFGRIGFLS